MHRKILHTFVVEYRNLSVAGGSQLCVEMPTFGKQMRGSQRGAGSSLSPPSQQPPVDSAGVT